MAQYPPLNFYNENDEPAGEAMLEEILDKGLLHRVVHVAVENDEGNILLQQRGPNVYSDPNAWHFAAAGYVDAGEGYLEAATRELKEELGVSGVELQDLGVVRERENVGGRDVNRFAGTFKAIIPKDTKFVLQESEVAAVRWFTKEQVRQLIDDEGSNLTAYLRRWLNEHYFQHEDN